MTGTLEIRQIRAWRYRGRPAQFVAGRLGLAGLFLGVADLLTSHSGLAPYRNLQRYPAGTWVALLVPTCLVVVLPLLWNVYAFFRRPSTRGRTPDVLVDLVLFSALGPDLSAVLCGYGAGYLVIMTLELAGWPVAMPLGGIPIVALFHWEAWYMWFDFGVAGCVAMLVSSVLARKIPMIATFLAAFAAVYANPVVPGLTPSLIPVFVAAAYALSRVLHRIGRERFERIMRWIICGLSAAPFVAIAANWKQLYP
jgi:hypothetical protein